MNEEVFPYENIISITDLREDINALTSRLAQYPYTFIFKNRNPFFIAVEPTWFKEKILTKKTREKKTLIKRQKAATYFDKVAKKVGNWEATKLVIEMREQEKRKWTK